MNIETVEEIYNCRIKSFQLKVYELQKKENMLAILRLLVFIVAIVLLFIFMSVSLLLAFVLLLLGLSGLGFLVKYNINISKQKKHNQYLSEINEKEIQCIHGNFRSFNGGFGYIDKEHSYTSDLDIFGKSSLFQYINRTTSKPGSDKLADWLNRPTSKVA